MEVASDRRKSERLSAAAGVLCGYGLLLALTASADPGDTRDYAKSITERFAGRDLFFWESGHLLWRPLGYLLVLIAHPARDGISSSAFYADVVHSLTAISVAMGAVALLAFLAWAQRLGIATVPAVGATLALATTCAFLNYAQTGTAYLPALAMLIVGLWSLAVADDRSTSRDIVPALSLAASVLFWLPMLFVVPVAAASPLILRGDSRRRRIAAVWACVLSGALVVTAYLAVSLIKRIYSPVDFRGWLIAASHGIQDSGGVSRAAIGLARSVLSTEQLGITAKRHLLGDPYSPATMADVVRAGLYRVALFYGAMGVLLVALARKRRHARVLAFLVLTAIPVLAFAVAWQGGDPERYFALFPALFLAIGVALSRLTPRRCTLVAAAMVAFLAAFNVHEFSRGEARRTCAMLRTRLRSLPASLRTHALLVTLSADQMTTLRGRCSDARDVNRADAVGVLALFIPHSTNADQWRQLFAQRALGEWGNGGRVLISTGLLAARPPTDWHWAEGDDPRVHWRDFPAFFDRLAPGDLGRAENSFVEVVASAANAAVLDSARRQVR